MGPRLEVHVRDVTVDITEVTAGEPRREFVLPDGSKAFEGKTLRDWLDQLGGPRGRVDSPAGTVEVDLTPWLDRDPMPPFCASRSGSSIQARSESVPPKVRHAPPAG